jgi:magnesium transporter
MIHKSRILYADDDNESVWLLLKLRLPPLLIGLFLGVLISFVMSRFEAVLTRNVRVAFFLPFIVYMAAAIGTQTEAIYARDLKTGKAKFMDYLTKESAIGVIVGLLCGVISGAIAWIWLNNHPLALSVGISMFVTVATAPLVALLTTEAMQEIREDPAAGAGPIATVIQDLLSILIYGLVSSVIILSSF